MQLWIGLYALIWLVFLDFLLAMIPLDPSLLGVLHGLVGLLVVALAYVNDRGLRRTRVPARVKRIAHATFLIAVSMIVLGGLLIVGFGAGWYLPLVGVSVFHAILFFHIVNGFAILTQAAAVAIAYDMWEDREFARETEPGEMPPPTPA